MRQTLHKKQELPVAFNAANQNIFLSGRAVETTCGGAGAHAGEAEGAPEQLAALQQHPRVASRSACKEGNDLEKLRKDLQDQARIIRKPARSCFVHLLQASAAQNLLSDWTMLPAARMRVRAPHHRSVSSRCKVRCPIEEFRKVSDGRLEQWLKKGNGGCGWKPSSPVLQGPLTKQTEL